jgi:hypothetical protein
MKTQAKMYDKEGDESSQYYGIPRHTSTPDMGITDNNTRPMSIWGWDGRSGKEQGDSRDGRRSKAMDRNDGAGDEYGLFRPGGIWDRHMNQEGEPQGKPPKYTKDSKKQKEEKSDKNKGSKKKTEGSMLTSVSSDSEKDMIRQTGSKCSDEMKDKLEKWSRQRWTDANLQEDQMRRKEGWHDRRMTDTGSSSREGSHDVNIKGRSINTPMQVIRDGENEDIVRDERGRKFRMTLIQENKNGQEEVIGRKWEGSEMVVGKEREKSKYRRESENIDRVTEDRGQQKNTSRSQRGEREKKRSDKVSSDV